MNLKNVISCKIYPQSAKFFHLIKSYFSKLFLIPLSIVFVLSACAEDDQSGDNKDEDTRDFNLEDGRFKLTKIEISGGTFELNKGSNFGIEVRLGNKVCF